MKTIRKASFVVLSLFGLATAAIAADTVFQTDKLKFGKASSSGDKSLVLDINQGANNPSIVSTPASQDMKLRANELTIGRASAGNKTITIDNGAGAANPKIRWNNGTSRIEFANDGTSFVDMGTGTDSPLGILNLGLSLSVASNQLTAALKTKSGSDPSVGSPVQISFRSATATDGTYSVHSFTASTAITLAAADTLGFTYSNRPLYFYAIQDTTSELCVSSRHLDDGGLFTATALTGGADTSASALYCPSAHTSRPIRLIGHARATNGGPNWVSVSRVSVSDFATGWMSESFLSSGSWTAPEGVTLAWVMGCGGGGGGGGGSGSGYGGDGGGGGGFAIVPALVVPGTTYNVTVGSGGGGGAGISAGVGSTANDGGTSSFGGSYIQFAGGKGGYGGNNAGSRTLGGYIQIGYGMAGGGHGGFGGNGSGGTPGEASVWAAGGGTTGCTFCGAGGGGGGRYDDGTVGAGGAGGTGTGDPGDAGRFPCGGGGGGTGTGASASNGGAGGDGFITVRWKL